jgi:LysR family transcriptional regulator, glycine cleavage system transcriptional activator
MRSAPAMTGLRALEAVIRTGSLSAAARELCVTPAAISHRLRELEARCGAPLVHRSGGRFEATETGRAVTLALGDAFQRIRLADDYLNGGNAGELRITASYSFAVLWLMPRIPLLERQFPETDLVINPTHDPLAAGSADVTIVHAARCPDGPGWTRLFEDRCAAVARAGHPFFGQDRQGLQDILDCRLLHISHDRGRDWGEYSWRDWAARHGLALPQTWKKGPSVSAEHLAAEMLPTSDLFALISVINASQLLASDRLKAVPGSDSATGCCYWIGSRHAAGPRSTRARRFVDVLIGELTT